MMAVFGTDYTKLRRAVGRFLGYDRDPTNWSTNETTDAGDILESGLRTFYWPIAPNGERYRWSFLRPYTQIKTTGPTGAPLPRDFGGLISELQYQTNEGIGKIVRVSDQEILSHYARGQLTGDPRYYAIRPRQFANDMGTPYELMLHPTPTSSITLLFRYAVIPPPLSDSNPYPYGGELHAETITEACLAAAERILEDGEGVHTKRWLECLATSIAIDREIDQ
jgi:hypothetical protein